jgi:predicted transcriptional regulator
MQDHDKQAAEQSLADLTAEVVSAYVSNNTISPNDIGPLIADVGHQLRSIGREQQALTPEKPGPVVSIRRSIGSDHLICLICGREQKLLKRHLATAHALMPDEYRRLFDLKADYPMVAPSYAEQRREFALKAGLGRPKKLAKKKRAPAEKQQVPARTGRPRAKAA